MSMPFLVFHKKLVYLWVNGRRHQPYKWPSTFNECKNLLDFGKNAIFLYRSIIPIWVSHIKRHSTGKWKDSFLFEQEISPQMNYSVGKKMMIESFQYFFCWKSMVCLKRKMNLLKLNILARYWWLKTFITIWKLSLRSLFKIYHPLIVRY